MSTSPPTRRIAHLDMDAFYASVELLRYPQLKGLPVVIGGSRRRPDDALLQQYADVPLSEIPVQAFPLLKDYTGRGVITTATYPARQFGVGSAMGLMKAAKLCPQAILLPVDFDEYRQYSRRFKEVITEIAPLMEDRGVDEVYIDFTDVPGGQREGGRTLARLIQKSILDATGLTCSIGVAPNKLLAKMASEFNKPNGISIVLPEPVSVSRETTFERDLHAVRDKAELGAVFTSLCERVAADLQRKGYVGKTIGIKLRYDDFKSVTRDQTIELYTSDAKTIRQAAGQCLKRVDLSRRLRLLGVRVGSLLRADEAPDLMPKQAQGAIGHTPDAMDSGAKTASLF